MFKKLHDIFSPVLSDTTIKKYMKKKLLIESPIEEIQLQPNSVDLTLSNTVKYLKHSCYYDYKRYNDRLLNHVDNYIDIRFPIKYITDKFEKGYTRSGNDLEYYILNPGDFVLMSTNEIINIPNGIIGFVQGRSSIARLGIQIEQAGLCDSGFRGAVTLEIFNETNERIMLFSGMRIAQIYFFKSQFANKIYGRLGNKYYNQQGPTESRINSDFKIS